MGPCHHVPCKHFKEVLSWGYFSSYAALTVQAGLPDQELMLGWGGCRVRPGICGPGAGGDVPFNTPGHQQCVKSGQRGSFKQESTHTSKAATKAVGLTALGFAQLVACRFQYICLFLHLAPLVRGTHSSVLPTKGEQRAARATKDVIFWLTSGSAALTARAT